MAQANRDAGIREAECEKAAMDVKYNTDTKIEDNSRAFKLQKAHFDKEVNTAVRIKSFWKLYFLRDCLLQKAEAQLAYELQAAKIQQKIRNEEIQIQVKYSVNLCNNIETFTKLSWVKHSQKFIRFLSIFVGQKSVSAKLIIWYFALSAAIWSIVG